MRPAMLNPVRDLAGATPETLARALFRRVEPLQPTRRKKAPKEKRPSDQPGRTA